MPPARMAYAVVLALSAGSVGTAAAAPSVTIEGEVIAAEGRWTSDGSRIVTVSTIRTPGGDVVVRQLGGRADGYGMRVSSAPAPFVVGMRVAVAARQAMDLSLRPHHVVDSARVLAWPPGFVRTGTTLRGNYLFWESGCVYLTVDTAGTKQLPGETEFGVIDASIAEWNGKTADCSFMNIVQERAEVEVGRDRKNVLKFRDVSWCQPAMGDEPPYCHSPFAAGITSTVYVDDADSDRDGAIVDADIELNGVDFVISNNGETLGGAGCKSDLANTLTHELGHLLGIEHPCITVGDPPRKDYQGNDVPSCSTVGDRPEITEATMFNFQDCGETKKATITDDEILAVCTIYPIADDPGECLAVGEEAGCCSTGGGNPAGALVLGGLVALGTFGRRRKSSPSETARVS